MTDVLNMKKFCSKLPIDILTDDIVKNLKVSLIERQFDNYMYVSNSPNANFDDLPFDGDQRLITR